MFSGVVEGMTQVHRLIRERGNLHITFACNFAVELQIGRNITHNGVYLTVVSLEEGGCTVAAVQEMLDRSNLGLLQVDDYINVECSMILGGRLDGHIMQGHVDQTVRCAAIREMDGSHYFTFAYEMDREIVHQGYITVEKGSVTANDVSLTVCNSQGNSFEAAVIPYTPEHTGFKYFKEGNMINLEFGILGKCIARLRSFD